MGTINITQGSDRLGKVPKKDFFPVRKVPKWQTHTQQTMVQSSERGQIPIYCTSRFSIERAEGPGTVCIRTAMLSPCAHPLPLPRLALQRILSLACTRPRHSRLCKHCAWACGFVVFHHFARMRICADFPCGSRVFQ